MLIPGRPAKEKELSIYVNRQCGHTTKQNYHTVLIMPYYTFKYAITLYTVLKF